MAQTQTYGAPKVQPAATPDIGQQGSSLRVNPQAFGSDIGDALQGAGSQFYQKALAIHKDEQAKQDDTILQGKFNKISNWKLQTIHDPVNGALAQEGEKALGLHDAVAESYDKMLSEARAGLNPRQQFAFDRATAGDKESVLSQVDSHIMGQTKVVAKQNADGAVENGLKLAVQNAANPERFASALHDARIAMGQYLKNSGVPDAEITSQLDAMNSTFHTGAINQLLALGMTGMAQQHFDAAKDEILGPDLLHVEQSLKVGDVRQQSAKAADAILGAATDETTLQDLLDQSDKIENVEVRDATEERIRNRFSVWRQQQSDNIAQQNAINKARLDAIYTSATDKVDATHAVEQIPANEWAQLTEPQRSSLYAYAKTVSAGKKVETDVPTYIRLLNMAGSPDAATQKQFTSLDFASPKYLNSLGESELVELQKMKNAILKGDKDAMDNAIRPQRDLSLMVNKTLMERGFDPNSKDPVVIGAMNGLWNQIEARAADKLRETKRTFLTAAEQQEIVDSIHIQNAQDNWDFFGLGTPDVPERIDLAPVPTALTPAMRTDIIGALRANGEDVTEHNINLYYGAWATRNATDRPVPATTGHVSPFLKGKP